MNQYSNTRTHIHSTLFSFSFSDQARDEYDINCMEQEKKKKKTEKRKIGESDGVDATDSELKECIWSRKKKREKHARLRQRIKRKEREE